MKYVFKMSLFLLVTLQLNCTGCDTETYVVSNPPLLVVGTDLLDFGDLPLEFTATRTIQLANAGQQELIFDALEIESEDNVFMLGASEISISGAVFRIYRQLHPRRCEGLRGGLTIGK